MNPRAFLEPLKFLTCRELLCQVVLVSKQWRCYAHTDEIWQDLCSAAGYSGPGPWILAYQRGRLMSSHVVFLWKREIALYDCRSGKLKTGVSLSEGVNAMEGTSHCFLGNGEVLACGGGTIKASHTSTWRISPFTGAVTALSSLRRPRKYHGIISFRDAIYTFGGTHSLRLLSSVEVYVSNLWTLIGKMLTPRMAFQPCIYLNIIYLPGGHTTSIEQFDPQKVTFTLLSLSLPCSSRTSAFVSNSHLYILTSSSLSLVTDTITTVKNWDMRCYEAVGDSPAVVFQGNVYFPVANWSVLVRVEEGWRYSEVHVGNRKGQVGRSSK